MVLDESPAISYLSDEAKITVVCNNVKQRMMMMMMMTTTMTMPTTMMMMMMAMTFFTVLLSALEQPHCSFVTPNSKRVTATFTAWFKYPLKWCTYSAVWLLHGCMVPHQASQSDTPPTELSPLNFFYCIANIRA